MSRYSVLSCPSYTLNGKAKKMRHSLNMSKMSVYFASLNQQHYFYLFLYQLNL